MFRAHCQTILLGEGAATRESGSEITSETAHTFKAALSLNLPLGNLSKYFKVYQHTHSSRTFLAFLFRFSKKTEEMNTTRSQE